ncbi:sulfonate transport system ATP-binding protein [Rhizobium sp. BK313]|uniref:ABC transporter ATP-binding protein n=1 Tax=Rhizobium sp. BK313 TaxID=2587081 RepID=UPI0010618109|nr:ABC transporter ATP-binding protein [Rhizobium sp. BK313]MBB3458773.1 sulfonate transport system ATP-binding protein [Rhizobium sp. BK313]
MAISAGQSSVRIKDLRRSFAGQTVIDGVDLEIRKGEFVALLGRSGSGKSTILRAVAGLDADARGSGHIEIPERHSVLFQDSRLLPWANVIDNVTLGIYDAGVYDRAKAALQEVELSGKENVWPKTLSGGEQQRVALARSLVRTPDLLLADEPFSALDALTRIRMQRLLLKLCQRLQPAVLFVTHDVEEALRLADRVVIIANGRISYDESISGVRSSPIRFETARDDILERLGVPKSGSPVQPKEL